MKKSIFPSFMLTAILASMTTGTMVSCDNEDLLGVEQHEAYVSNFERMFGAVNPEHDFKTFRTVSIDAEFAPSMKAASTLSVYDGMPTNGNNTSLVGRFGNLTSFTQFKVDVNRNVNTLYYVLNDGVTSKLYTSPVPQEGGKVSARFTNEPTASYPDAIDGLFDIHYNGTPFYIDRSEWRVVSVNSEHVGNEASMAFDNDPNTFWHTDYPERPDFPHTLVVDMVRTYQVTHFTYLSRQDGQKNGMVVDYEVYVSEDGEDWGTPVLTGKFEDTTALQVAELETSKAGRYLKFVSFSEFNGGLRTSASEIGIYTSADLSATGEQPSVEYAWFSYDFYRNVPDILSADQNLFDDRANHSSSASDFVLVADDVTGDVILYPIFCNESYHDEVGYYILDSDNQRIGEGVLITDTSVDIADCMKVATTDGNQIIRNWNYCVDEFFDLVEGQSILSKPFVIHAGIGNRVGLYIKNSENLGGRKFYSQAALNPDNIPVCVYAPFVNTVTHNETTVSITVQTTFAIVGLEDKVYSTNPVWPADFDMNDIMFYTENVVSYETELDRRNSVTVAVEDLGTTDDFDFNDIVLTFDYTTGMTTATVNIQALGGTIPVYLHQSDGRGGNTPLLGGRELHAVMGYNNPNTFINTCHANEMSISQVDIADGVPPFSFDIQVPEDFTVGEDGLPFYFVVEGAEGQIRINPNTETGSTPQVLVISKYYYPDSAVPSLAEEPMHWAWPKERVNVNQAYTRIADWVANPNDLRFLTEGIVESNLYK